MPTVEIIRSLIVVVLYLGFVFVWVTYLAPRLEALFLRYLSERIGKPVRKRIMFRSEEWKISGEHTVAQGCLVFLANMGYGIGCFILPIFFALGVMGLILFALSGEFSR